LLWVAACFSIARAFSLHLSFQALLVALERIFFHDVMNSATILLSSITLLQEQQDGQPNQLTDLMSASADQLVDEIKAQQLLTQAENNELTLQLEPLHVAAEDI
jgi:hypothetical protein